MSTESILESLRLPDNFSQSNTGIKQPLKPTFGKLNKHRFSRVNPDPAFQSRVLLVTDKEGDRESYLANPKLAPNLGGMAAPKILRLAVDNAGIPRLIAEPIIDPTGRSNLWFESYSRAIRAAEKSWVRIEARLEAGQYEIVVASGDLGDPIWPSRSMDDLVMECFEGRIIETADHPLIRQLEGKV